MNENFKNGMGSSLGCQPPRDQLLKNLKNQKRNRFGLEKRLKYRNHYFILRSIEFVHLLDKFSKACNHTKTIRECVLEKKLSYSIRKEC